MTTDHDPGRGRASWAGGTEMDGSRPQSARVYDYLLGGKDNFAPDRAAAEALLEAMPDLALMVQSQRAFLARAVRHLVTARGVRQFLDLGSGIPAAGNVHEVAQRLAPDARVLYVDNDPVVGAHARALEYSTPEGVTAFVLADVRDPAAILTHPGLRATLDRSRPVALMLVGILHHLRDDDDPAGVVSALVDWLPPGSYVAVAGPTADFDPDATAALARVAEDAGIPYVARSRAEVVRILDGLAIEDPGVVPLHEWRPDGEEPDGVPAFGWAVLAGKP